MDRTLNGASQGTIIRVTIAGIKLQFIIFNWYQINTLLP
jgi:hypothetical protein